VLVVDEVGIKEKMKVEQISLRERIQKEGSRGAI
jgi:hypothetical protein